MIDIEIYNNPDSHDYWWYENWVFLRDRVFDGKDYSSETLPKFVWNNLKATEALECINSHIPVDLIRQHDNYSSWLIEDSEFELKILDYQIMWERSYVNSGVQTWERDQKRYRLFLEDITKRLDIVFDYTEDDYLTQRCVYDYLSYSVWSKFKERSKEFFEELVEEHKFWQEQMRLCVEKMDAERDRQEKLQELKKEILEELNGY